MPNQIMEIFGPTIPSTKVMIKDVYDEDENLCEVCNKPNAKLFIQNGGSD